MPTDSFLSRLAALRAKGIAALLRHVRRPNVYGAVEEHFRLWACANEARYAAAEGNTAFAATLLPTLGVAEPVGEGIPLLPAGVRWAVDEVDPNTITVTVDVAGVADAQARVTSPAGVSFTADVTVEPARLTTSFRAATDGVFAVALSSSNNEFATIYVPVTRALFRALREDSRALGYAFRRALPPAPSDAYRLRLALLVCAESAAQTAQVELADALLADAAALGQASTPTALYPYPRG